MLMLRCNVNEYRPDYTAKWDSSGGIKGAAGGREPRGAMRGASRLVFVVFVSCASSRFLIFFHRTGNTTHMFFSFSLVRAHLQSSSWFSTILSVILGPRFLVLALLIASLCVAYPSTSVPPSLFFLAMSPTHAIVFWHGRSTDLDST